MVLNTNAKTMKTRLIPFVFWTFLLIMEPILTFAQKQKKWNVGISASYGKDFFYKKYHVQKSMIPPGAITHFHSFGSLKSAISVERFLKPRLSIRAQAEYSVAEMPNYIVFEIWTLDYDEKNQRDHWGAFSVGVRKYFKSESPCKIFADLGAQGDYFLGYRRFPVGHEHKFYWGAEDYSRFVPSVYAGLGVRWKRFTLTADYQANVARTFLMDMPKIYNNPDFPKRSVTRQGISLKATFLLIKAGEKCY